MPEPSVASLGDSTAAYLQLPGGWFRNNAGWITGRDHTVLVDTCATHTLTARLLDALRLRTEPRPLTAVITHAHGDHANGAGQVARTGATILASTAAAAEIGAGPHLHPTVFHYDDWGDVTPPELIRPVSGHERLDLGDQVVEVHAIGHRAHTDGDLVVWAPRDGVLFAGDLLFNGVTPLALSGSVTGWLTALDRLAQFDARHIVPGHGPVIDPDQAIGAVREYLRWLLDAVDGAPDFPSLQQQGRDRWPDWPDSERHAANLRIAHADLHSTTCDPAIALAAMIDMAGGPISLDL